MQKIKNVPLLMECIKVDSFPVQVIIRHPQNGQVLFSGDSFIDVEKFVYDELFKVEEKQADSPAL